MSMLAPLWMLLAGAAAVPLLIHLLRRRSGTRTEFPAARYLVRAERDHSRSLRLRNLLLMLLRVAIVLLLAVAAARPVARWLGGWWGGARSPTAIAIVIDNSMSTGVVTAGRPLFETLRDSARVAVNAAQPADRVWIVTADARLLGGTSAGARAALDSLALLHGAGNLAAAMQRASSAVMGATGHAPRIAVFTDGQRSAWSTTVDVPRDVGVIVFSPSDPAPLNRGIVRVDSRPVRWTPRGELAIGMHSADSVGFRVLLHGSGSSMRTIARGVAPPSEETVIRAAPPDTGWLGGRVEIDPDELPGDDVRHFALWIGAAPRVRATQGAGPFVGNALDVLRSEGRAREGDEVRFASADEAAGATPTMLTPPRSAAQLGAANRGLERLGIPWRFGRVQEGRLRAPDGLDGAIVRAAYELVPAGVAVADTLATLDGRPWAVAGIAGVPYVLVASALHPDATDIPIRAAFVPWLASLLHERLAGGAGGVVYAAPGAPVRTPAWADAMRLGNGVMLALAQPEFTAPAVPGVHFFRRDGRTAGALVVNAEESESVLERLAQDGVAGRIEGARVRQVHETPAWRDTLFASDAPRSMVGLALLAVLLLLGAELAATMIRTRGAT